MPHRAIFILLYTPVSFCFPRSFVESRHRSNLPYWVTVLCRQTILWPNCEQRRTISYSRTSSDLQRHWKCRTFKLPSCITAGAKRFLSPSYLNSLRDIGLVWMSTVLCTVWVLPVMTSRWVMVKMVESFQRVPNLLDGCIAVVAKRLCVRAICFGLTCLSWASVRKSLTGIRWQNSWPRSISLQTSSF